MKMKMLIVSGILNSISFHLMFNWLVSKLKLIMTVGDSG